ATNKDGYRSHPYGPYRGIRFYEKKHDNNTNIEKMEYKVYGPNKHNKVISEIWDPDSKNFLEYGSVKEYHATNKDGYRSHPYGPYRGIRFYEKKHDNNTNIEKMEYKVYGPNKHNKVISEIWDPDSKNFLEYGSVKVKIERVYNPNLVLIQQRYKNGPLSREKYFYALVKKVQISHDTTIIAMVSPNVNDHHPSNIKYKNPI
ncbi:Acidic phosphoprotein precursor PCEMA1, putative, partial [Plasmodium chabaudi chabaudi]